MSDDNGKEISNLENDFELQMEEPEERESVDDSEISSEFEKEAQSLHEGPDESEAEEEPADYVQRFLEIQNQEFETEMERDEAIDNVLNEMERDFFFKGLLKKIKKVGPGLMRGLLKKGLSLAKNLPAFQAFKGITALARGDLKGLLRAGAKGLLGTVMPASVPVMSAIGLEAPADADDINRYAWENFVRIAEVSFETLADNLNTDVDDPLVASRLAYEAYSKALRTIQRPAILTSKHKRVIVIKPGERILIVSK